MTANLTDRFVTQLPCPDCGHRITYDSRVRGFGIRVTSTGNRSFILNYRTTKGVERRCTIGPYPRLSVHAARRKAEKLKGQVHDGRDPVEEARQERLAERNRRQQERSAPTVRNLVERYRRESMGRLRQHTRASYESMLDNHVLPALGHLKLAEVRRKDVAALHRELGRSTPFQANRVLSVVAIVFELAVQDEVRPDNPARGIPRHHEEPRHRYLSRDEQRRFLKALEEIPSPAFRNAVKIAILTGKRMGEILQARWEQFDLEGATWSQPASLVKQKRIHTVPLNSSALEVLRAMKPMATSEWLFPSRTRKGSYARALVNAWWGKLLAKAKITDFRFHDVRHTFASNVVSAGHSLPQIGALLGHSSPQTTSRYAHLMMDPLREASEKAGESYEAAQAAGDEAT
jgi:integrase